MPTLPQPEVILTHESDLDGFLAGLLCCRLARRLFDADVPLQAFHNHGWRQRNLKERSAWVCDMSFESRLDKTDWVVIDHHPTNVVPERAKLIHDPGKSAALLCYELCCQQGLGTPKLDRLVHLSNVADLFLEQDSSFDLANDYANLVKTYQFWNLFHLVDGDPERLLDHPLLEVMAVKRRVENPLGFAFGRDHVTEITPRLGLVQTVVGNANLVVHRLLAESATPYPVLMTLFRRGSGVYLASLRSRNGEALKFAELLQGGGHPNASGATLPRSVQDFAGAIQYLSKVLNPAQNAVPPPKALADLFD